MPFPDCDETRRNVYKEYKQGLICWDEAYKIASNNAATTVDDDLPGAAPIEETEYWTEQMDFLAESLAESFMETLGYYRDKKGIYTKPGKADNV